MISNDGSASKEYKDMCVGPKNFARIAYNNDVWFDIWYGEMWLYPVYPVVGEYPQVVYDWEILKPFFEEYHITPTWINCNYTWGIFDEETGHWTGAVGKVRRAFKKLKCIFWDIAHRVICYNYF